MILEVPQLQVIDRLRDYSSCASGSYGIALVSSWFWCPFSLPCVGVLALRGSGARVFVRGYADMSYDCALALRGSGARVSVFGYADMGKYCALALLGSGVVLSCGGRSFSPDDAYGSAWDSALPMKGEYTINYIRTKGFACCMTGYAAMTSFAPTTTTSSSS